MQRPPPGTVVVVLGLCVCSVCSVFIRFSHVPRLFRSFVFISCLVVRYRLHIDFRFPSHFLFYSDSRLVSVGCVSFPVVFRVVCLPVVPCFSFTAVLVSTSKINSFKVVFCLFSGPTFPSTQHTRTLRFHSVTFVKVKKHLTS